MYKKCNDCGNRLKNTDFICPYCGSENVSLSFDDELQKKHNNDIKIKDKTNENKIDLNKINVSNIINDNTNNDLNESNINNDLNEEKDDYKNSHRTVNNVENNKNNIYIEAYNKGYADGIKKSNSPLEIDEPSTGLCILSFLFPQIGLLLGLYNQHNHPISSTEYFKYTLISVIIYSIIGFIFLLVILFK